MSRPSLPRARFPIRWLMVAVAIAALVADRLRPISRAEVAGIAEARFLAIPGSARWDGRYEVRVCPDDSGRPGAGWVVLSLTLRSAEFSRLADHHERMRRGKRSYGIDDAIIYREASRRPWLAPIVIETFNPE